MSSSELLPWRQPTISPCFHIHPTLTLWLCHTCSHCPWIHWCPLQSFFLWRQPFECAPSVLHSSEALHICFTPIIISPETCCSSSSSVSVIGTSEWPHSVHQSSRILVPSTTIHTTPLLPSCDSNYSYSIHHLNFMAASLCSLKKSLKASERYHAAKEPIGRTSQNGGADSGFLKELSSIPGIAPSICWSQKPGTQKMMACSLFAMPVPLASSLLGLGCSHVLHITLHWP